MTMTTEDAIKAATTVARDVADGRLSPTELEVQAVTELQALVGTVVGPGHPVWPLQVDIARQVLALDGVPTDELAEWLAVARQRAGEHISVPDPDETPPAPVTLPSAALSAPSTDPEPEALADAEPEPVAEVVSLPTPPPRADVYDPLAGWLPGRPRR